MLYNIIWLCLSTFHFPLRLEHHLYLCYVDIRYLSIFTGDRDEAQTTYPNRPDPTIPLDPSHERPCNISMPQQFKHISIGLEPQLPTFKPFEFISVPICSHLLPLKFASNTCRTKNKPAIPYRSDGTLERKTNFLPPLYPQCHTQDTYIKAPTPLVQRPRPEKSIMVHVFWKVLEYRMIANIDLHDVKGCLYVAISESSSALVMFTRMEVLRK